MKKLYLILIAFLLCQGLTAQVNTDSLWRIWQTSSLPDTVRLVSLQRLAFNYINSNSDSARLIAQTALTFAQQKALPRWQARALNYIGLTYRFQSDHVHALESYEQSIALLEKAGDRNYLAVVYGNMGDIYRLKSNFSKAIDCITKSMSLAEETGDRKHAADAYVSIATIYYDDRANDIKTLEYLEKARAVYEALHNEPGLALVYSNLSAVYLEQEDFYKALSFTDKALIIHEKVGDTYGLATSLHNRAVIYTNLGRFQEASADFDHEIAIFQRMRDQEGLADAYNSIGEMRFQQKNYAAAIQVCDKALQIALRMGSPNLRQVDACNCLYKAHLQQGNYRQALDYLEQYVATKDSLQQNETTQKLRQMEIERQTVADSLGREKEKFRTEMRHQQALRQKDKTVGFLLVAGLGALTVALAFWVRMLYFRRRSQRYQARSAELSKQQLINEIALLRTQVNPHFLFNSLSILSSLVRVDPDLSEQFIEQLSRSYRYILEQKEQSLVTLRTELEFIKSYSFLLTIRFAHKLQLHIQLPEEALDSLTIAPLTLQLLIENAVKHNRMSEKEPLVITVSMEAGQLLVVKNLLQPRTSSVISTGVGLQNIINRYALLTDRAVWAGETEEEFVVKVPLLS